MKMINAYNCGGLNKNSERICQGLLNIKFSPKGLIMTQKPQLGQLVLLKIQIEYHLDTSHTYIHHSELAENTVKKR
jgi:hypothetical protein